MRGIVVLVVLVLLGLVVAPVVGVSQGQASSTVTLTVLVETDAGEAVGGAELTASWDSGSSTATTASNGKAFIDVPEGADVTITVDHDDYVRNRPYQVEDASERDVTIRVARKASATITVRDSEGPIDGAAVAFSRNGRTVATAQTNAKGKATSGIVEEGDYRVTVTKSRYLTNRTDLEITGETTQRIQIERGFVTVEFKVVDPHFDPAKPVADATVTVKNVGEVNTQSNGLQQVSVPVNAEFDVVVSKDGYQHVRGKVRTREQDKSVRIRVSRTPALTVEPVSRNIVVGERVSLEVTDEYGDPVANATIYRNDEAVTTTDAEGEALVEIPTVGDHLLRAENGSLSSDPVTVAGIEAGSSDETPTPTQTETSPTPTASPTAAPTTEAPGQPGFGLGIAIISLLVAIKLGRKD